jgi:hypothetical protein
MRTFYVHADINKLLEQVGMSDDWIGAIIDAFVIDYVFERPSVIAETMEELEPPACKVCGDPYSAHRHNRSGDRLWSMPLRTVPSDDDDAHPVRHLIGYWANVRRSG